jgi:hypothetical protein
MEPVLDAQGSGLIGSSVQTGNQTVKTAIVVAGLVLAFASSAACAAPARDEARASHYLDCAALESYFSFAAGQAQPRSGEIATRQAASNEFWKASVLFSDDAFVTARKPVSLQHVRGILAGNDKAAKLSAEDAACAGLRRNDVVPLLQSEKYLSSGDFQTSVPVGQVENIRRDIVQWHAEQHPDCPFRQVIAAREVDKGKDSTTENWTIEACDAKRFTYRVLLMPQEGGMSDAVSNAEAPAAQPGEAQDRGSDKP